ncbi:MAG: hypothetical protein IBJ03_04280 [Gemmatimonadaceae bacterium]|nr:hypothetical protein [Gemmatimonadaceae bacterium]
MRRYTTILAATAAVALVSSATIASAQTQPPTRLPAAKVVGDSLKAITVQNDRHTAVTLFVEADRVERALGTVDANSTSTLELPTWALTGQKNLKLFAKAEGEGNLVARYSLPVTDARLGLLVPPAKGLPRNDSLVITLPKGVGTAATVTVDNERTRPVTVFAEQGLVFVRLGEVAANDQATLALPAALTRNKGEIRVFARPQGAQQVSTKAMRLKDGDNIAVIIM